MAEGSLNKVKRLVLGGVADVVEAAEARNPLLVMKEAARETQRGVDRARAELSRVASRRIIASRQASDARAKIDELAEKAREAAAIGRPDIAKALISRQIDLEARLSQLVIGIKDIVEAEGALQGAVSELTARKQEMDDEIAILRSIGAASGTREGGDVVSDTRRQVSAASEAFERAKLAMGAPFHGAIPDVEVIQKIAEFDAVARLREIENRLANLTTNVSSTTA